MSVNFGDIVSQLNTAVPPPPEPVTAAFGTPVDPIYVRKFLDCHSDHFDERTRGMLLAGNVERHLMRYGFCTVIPTPDGVLFYVGHWFPDPHGSFPEGRDKTLQDHPTLALAIDKALSLGCRYIWVDTDGPAVDGLLDYSDEDEEEDRPDSDD